MRLLPRWNRLFDGLGLEVPAGGFDELVARYREAHRAYHTLGHIEACFHELDQSGLAASAALELALFFHDVVYDPRAHDNEAASAAFAHEMLARVGASASLRADIERLVLATRHAAVPDREDERLLVDIDLSILGTEASTFDVYEREIREEYAFVPEAAFRAGRSAVLEGILARPKIYSTPPFDARYELRARENLARSIARLRGSESSRPAEA
jgi:predicted metal-dependent HD superfamily phosphohydrolase